MDGWMNGWTSINEITEASNCGSSKEKKKTKAFSFKVNPYTP
jgi:hypothetical protein